MPDDAELEQSWKELKEGTTLFIIILFYLCGVVSVWLFLRSHFVLVLNYFFGSLSDLPQELVCLFMIKLYLLYTRRVLRA